MLNSLLRPLIALCMVLGWAIPTLVYAHDARPVYVKINEIGPERFSVHWKVPVSVPVFAVPTPILPPNCQPLDDGISGRAGDGYTYLKTYSCADGLSGNVIRLNYPNNNPSLNALFRLNLLNGETYTHILSPGAEIWQVPESENLWHVSTQYTQLGIEHILAGIDHLLFVVCLIIIAGKGHRIIVTVTGFTLAHSVTLALSALNVVALPVPPVEAAIALSIVFLAHEIVIGNHRSWTWRYPLLVSIAFGLLHGFGFASALKEIGLPQTELPAALLFFNLGVEIGQILFIAVLLFGAVLIRKILSKDRKHFLEDRGVTTFGSYAIGIIASYWLIDRIAGF